MKPKVLIVDDEDSFRKTIVLAFEREGFSVFQADNGEDAVSIAKKELPDLILLDLIMPKMAGTDVLQHLKSDDRTRDIPVVVLSSLSERNRVKLMEAGAEEYLEKGILMPKPGVNLLPQKLEGVVRLINRRRGTQPANPPTSR